MTARTHWEKVKTTAIAIMVFFVVLIGVSALAIIFGVCVTAGLLIFMTP